MEWVDVVDEQDRVIGVAERARVRQENLRHRASYILVLDEAGRILVQRRTPSKDFCPGMLDACAGGVVTTGEAMALSARRELAEELGIAVDPADCIPMTFASAPLGPRHLVLLLFRVLLLLCLLAVE